MAQTRVNLILFGFIVSMENREMLQNQHILNQLETLKDFVKERIETFARILAATALLALAFACVAAIAHFAFLSIP